MFFGSIACRSTVPKPTDCDPWVFAWKVRPDQGVDMKTDSKNVRQETRSARPPRADRTKFFFTRAIGAPCGREVGFSLTCANPKAGHGLGQKNGSEKKLVRSRRSLITDGLELIGHGLKTAMSERSLYIWRGLRPAEAARPVRCPTGSGRVSRL